MNDVAREPFASVDADATMRKVAWRLMPFLVVCYCASYLDRVNLSFAATEMNRDLGFSPSVYGWGAGIFFIGYALLETPSNYILHRVGARRWIARIMVSWGVASALMAYVWDARSFFALRFLLGAAEAGFMPGVILYLTYWIPRERRAGILAAFLFAVPLSTVVGAPVSGVLLSVTDGLAGLKGWQWLFILESIPPLLLGVVTYFFLTDKPSDARWLSLEERGWLASVIEKEESALHGVDDHGLGQVFRDPRTLSMGVAYFGVVLALYGLSMWLPQIVTGFGIGPISVGFITAIPFLCGSVAMFVWSRRSDRLGERVRHTVWAAIVAALGLAGAAWTRSPAGSIVILSIAASGTLAVLPTFWAFSTASFTGTRAAIAIALINSIGNLAGFVGPYLVGWIKQASGSFSFALLALSVGPMVCAALVAALGRKAARIV